MLVAMMDVQTAAFFLNAANILYLVCYGVRDVLWLRIFCVTAIVTIMPYYIWGEGGCQRDCILWNLAFLAINMFWIVVIIRQRRPPRMTEYQRALYLDVFEGSFTPQQMLQLLSVAKTENPEQGEKFIKRSTDPNGLILIDRGSAEVIVDGNLVAKLKRGDFVGEMSFLTGEPAVADVLAGPQLQYLKWTRDELEDLFEGRAELKSALNEIVGRDLVRKLTSVESGVPELSVDSIQM